MARLCRCSGPRRGGGGECIFWDGGHGEGRGGGLESNNDSDWEFDLCQTLESIIGGADFAQEAATFGLAAGTAGVAYAALAAIPGATIPFAAAAATAGGAVIAGSGALGIGSLGVEALARIIRSANGCPG
jgi:hypothetical protein